MKNISKIKVFIVDENKTVEMYVEEYLREVLSAEMPASFNENRFMHVTEPKRMGAALVLAGLAAEGKTEICEVHHLNRGYVNMVEKMQGLGADIQRISKE